MRWSRLSLGVALLSAACHERGVPVTETRPHYKSTVQSIRTEGTWLAVDRAIAADVPDRLIYHQLPRDHTVPRALVEAALQLPTEHVLARETFPVILETVLNESGRIERARVLSAPQPFPDLEEVLAASLRPWRFEPATIAGKPVAVYYNIVIHHVAEERPTVR